MSCPLFGGQASSSYVYDAQNRLTSATKSGTTDTFLYDGLNRQIGKKIGTQALYYRVYDGWDLLGEYKTGTTGAFWAYLYGTGGVVKNLVTNNYYYQDASGSTSHVANSSGTLKEYYRYDLQGAPLFFNAAGQPLNDTAIGVRHLFAGQQWYTELVLYDLRNRYYSPDTGRFLQADPIGFDGDASNLYRHCGNNAVNRSDPLGTTIKTDSTVDPNAYNKAIDYLSHSQTFRDVYSQLENSSTTYTVTQINDRIDTQGDRFDPNSTTIFWDPQSPLITDQGGEQSPALGLAHELGHADFYDQSQALADLLNSIDLPGYQGSLEELRNITQVEDPIAEDLGEPTRENHGGSDSPDRVSDPTDGVWGYNSSDSSGRGSPHGGYQGQGFYGGGMGTGFGAGTGMMGGWAGGMFANAAQAANYYNNTGEYSGGGGGGYRPGMGYLIVRVY